MTFEFPHKAKGKALTNIGELVGYKRRFWGLEFDYFFRKRILKNVKNILEQKGKK